MLPTASYPLQEQLSGDFKVSLHGGSLELLWNTLPIGRELEKET